MIRTLMAAVAAPMLAAALTACGGESEAAERVPLAEAQGTEVVVYKTPTCGCCAAWGDHLREAGFTVKEVDQPYAELTKTKREHGIGQHEESCHTGLVDGYVVEGHVPAADIARMLRERPDIRGLAVPGMPMGSPGMEGPVKQDYDVLALQPDGTTSVYASH